MLMWHIVLLPVVVGVLVVAHLLLVRRRGIVPPPPLPGTGSGAGPDTPSDAPQIEEEP